MANIRTGPAENTLSIFHLAVLYHMLYIQTHGAIFCAQMTIHAVILCFIQFERREFQHVPNLSSQDHKRCNPAEVVTERPPARHKKGSQ